MNKASGISKRWFYTTFCVITGFVVIFCITAIILIRGYYYNYVKMTLDSHASDLVDSYFSYYIGNSDEVFVKGAINFAEGFSDREMMDVWVIDRTGKPVVSSSGFEIEPDITMPDYEAALTSESEKGFWQGRLSNGEKVMATTAMLPVFKGQAAGAVRYICSLQDVDRALVSISLLVLLIAAVIVFLIYSSGSFFIRSIVRPVLKVNETAKQISKGDLSVRVDTSGMHDEIDELCTTFNQMAETLGEAEKMKNDFISTISHELRTPLTAIKGWGETLMQIGSTDSVTTKKGMGVIISEAERLAQMVEELLDFSRMQNGKIQLIKNRIDVLAELDDAVFAMQNKAQQAGIELTYSIPDTPMPILGDAARIRQVFLNLIDNAIKYNKPGGNVDVLAEIKRSKLVIYFTDTGCGISKENLPKIKEKFFRANMAVHGTGIGLAVADEIIKLHGGSLDVDSVLGKGTTVTLTMPVNSSETEHDISERIQNK